MRPKGAAEELQRRRLRAVILLQDGHGPTEVGRMVGADRRTVQRWARRFEAGGEEAMLLKPHPGRPCKLAEEQQSELVEELLKGPLAHGFSTDLWTCARIGKVIQNVFGVTYEASAVWRLLDRMDWSCQKPKKRAVQRNEQAIETWLKKDWPRIKKHAAA